MKLEVVLSGLDRNAPQNQPPDYAAVVHKVKVDGSCKEGTLAIDQDHRLTRIISRELTLWRPIPSPIPRDYLSPLVASRSDVR